MSITHTVNVPTTTKGAVKAIEHSSFVFEPFFVAFYHVVFISVLLYIISMLHFAIEIIKFKVLYFLIFLSLVLFVASPVLI
jgi:hypothetical protein